MLETTTTVRSSRSASASRTWSGLLESSTVSSTPYVAQITSGASEEPPMPQSTTWSTPASASSLRSAATSPTSGRDVRGRVTQDSRLADSSSASGPHSVASFANSLLAKDSAASAGTWARIASAAAPVATTSNVSLTSPRPAPGRAGRGRSP